MGRLVAGLLVVLLLPTVAALEDADVDAEGDVRRTIEEPADDPRVDIVVVVAEYDEGILALRMQVAGTVPTPDVSEPQENETLTYLFVVGFQEADRGSLYQDHDFTATCRLTTGTPGLDCDVVQDGYVIRSIGASGSNVTLSVTVPDPSAVTGLVVGGGASAVLRDGERSDLRAQDFTPQADPFGGTTGGGGHDHDDRDDRKARPDIWWQSPWILVVALAVGIGIGVAYNRRRKS